MADQRSVPRRDAFAKVTGRAAYSIDATMPFQAHGAVVRSERAHARIQEIDAGDALAAPGVIAVVTAADLVGIRSRFGHIIPDHPILAGDRVRYFGEPVALVVAESLHDASDAASLVRVEYDELPESMDPAAALATGATPIHTGSYLDPGAGFLEVEPAEQTDNVAHQVQIGWGDVDAAMAGAATLVANTVRFPMVYAYAMETYNAVAEYQPGRLHVVSTAQHPLMVRKELAAIFGLPLSAVRVEVPYVGGGYGSKSYTKLEPLAAVGSWVTGRPVKVTTDVEAAINTTRADGAVVTMRTGFDAEGRIVARDAEIELDTGAYADNSPLVLTKCAHRCFGPYRVPALRVVGRAVYTNTTPASSYRGFGAPQGALAGELNLEYAAECLGMDPVELRRINLAPRGTELMPGKRPIDADLLADMDDVRAALDEHAMPPTPGVRRGRALALSASDAGASPISTAHVRMHADGSATLLTSSTELGQGSRTALAQMVADRLGIDVSRVAVGQSDTLFTPYEWTTGASRTTTLVGLAISAACDDIWSKLRSMHAESMGIDATDVVERDGQLVVVGTDESSSAPGAVDPADVIRTWFGADAGEVTGVGVIRRSGATAQLPPFWEVGIVGVEVAVAERTGEVTVEHLVMVGDVGFAVNPALVKGQDLGAATQGLGCALWEELVYDGQQLANPNLIEYRVPRMRDVPRRITSLVAERADGVGPSGVKGSGEGAMNPIPAAVVAAVAKAIGVWPDTLPLTPTRVWSLLQRTRDDEAIHLPPTASRSASHA
ncbi:xanthine dehydrogenase family protein molybdopterin-binding subunit [Desertimonas flava]|uniref:xanthine dehydrogenase family protein molybdopterin-binding subunit n=1 Tax=Desertimonas flava TaxID=2064846 RepID=UPI000E346258|nr:xanthine dehydrogenase family protein molybdopterin-binding subunit [Desertimonas flava]